MQSHPNDLPHPLQIEAWRRMGATGRSELGKSLRQQVREWKRGALKAQHPEWTNERLRQELAAIYLRGNS